MDVNFFFIYKYKVGFFFDIIFDGMIEKWYGKFDEYNFVFVFYCLFLKFYLFVIKFELIKKFLLNKYIS